MYAFLVYHDRIFCHFLPYFCHASVLKCCQQYDSTTFVIHINWTRPTKTYHTSKYSRTTVRESLHESSTRFPARSWPSVAKCLSNEECNEELHFPVSCYCNCHTDSCKNYKKSQLYNTKHYLINTCVLGGNICLRTLFSNNVIYLVCPYVQHQTCDRRLLPPSCVSVPPHRATGIPLYGF